MLLIVNSLMKNTKNIKVFFIFSNVGIIQGFVAITKEVMNNVWYCEVRACAFNGFFLGLFSSQNHVFWVELICPKHKY